MFFLIFRSHLNIYISIYLFIHLSIYLFIHLGIYWGFCRIGTNPAIFKTACSIGYNPYYGNKTKTVEPHLIASIDDSEHRHASSCGETLLGEFYDQPIRLTLVGYLRPELPFEGLEKLVAAIKQGELC